MSRPPNPTGHHRGGRQATSRSYTTPWDTTCSGATQNRAVFERTCELVRRAIALDPAYPSPYAALGMALAQAYYDRWTYDPERSFAEAGTLVDAAIGRDLADPFAQLAALGLIALFTLQAGIHIAVNVGIAPAKGMTLPLISYGGSSMLASALTLGMAFALTRKRPGAFIYESDEPLP